MTRLSKGFWLCNMLLLIFLTTTPTKGQNNFEDFADQLHAETDDIDFALKEYLRAYYFSNASDNDTLITKIAQLYFLKCNYDKALQYYDLKYFQSKDFNVKNLALEGKILSNIAKNNPNQALINAHQMTVFDTSSLDTKYFYISFCSLLRKDYKSSLSNLKLISYVTSSTAKKLENVIGKITKIDQKNPNYAIFWSAFLPGLGQTIYRDYKDGFKSFALISGLAILFFEISNKISFADAILSVGPWITRYEIGGLVNAKKTAIKSIDIKRNEEIIQFISIIQSAKFSKI